MREDLSSEKLEDRVKKMQQQLVRDNWKENGSDKISLSVMQIPVSHKILNQQFWLTTDRTMFWEEEKALIVSDLTFWKNRSFQKIGHCCSGIGL